MARTYIQMLNLAVEKQQAFNRAHDFALRHPDNIAAEREEMRHAADLCGYCDAIADMFGKGYDDVYQIQNFQYLRQNLVDYYGLYPYSGGRARLHRSDREPLSTRPRRQHRRERGTPK